MGALLLTDLEERLASDADGSIRMALRQQLVARKQMLDATRTQLRKPAAHIRFQAACDAVEAAITILDTVRVGSPPGAFAAPAM
jgi:hypothetical protein